MIVLKCVTTINTNNYNNNTQLKSNVKIQFILLYRYISKTKYDVILCLMVVIFLHFSRINGHFEIIIILLQTV